MHNFQYFRFFYFAATWKLITCVCYAINNIHLNPMQWFISKKNVKFESAVKVSLNADTGFFSVDMSANVNISILFVFIGPKFDHCIALSVTPWLCVFVIVKVVTWIWQCCYLDLSEFKQRLLNESKNSIQLKFPILEFIAPLAMYSFPGKGSSTENIWYFQPQTSSFSDVTFQIFQFWLEDMVQSRFHFVAASSKSNKKYMRNDHSIC